MKEWLEEMTDKKEEEFRVQFKDSIQIMAGALKAGYSAENGSYTHFHWYYDCNKQPSAPV